MGCAKDPPLPLDHVVLLKTPAVLRDCKAQPPVPPVTSLTDQDFAVFVQDSLDAGADCRDKMGRRNAIEDAQGAPP